MSSTFSVITNLPSLVAQHNSTQNQQSLQRTLLSVTMVYPPPRWLIHQGISPTPSPG